MVDGCVAVGGDRSGWAKDNGDNGRWVSEKGGFRCEFGAAAGSAFVATKGRVPELEIRAVGGFDAVRWPLRRTLTVSGHSWLLAGRN